MIKLSKRSRQPLRMPWTRERLYHERSILLGMTIDRSTSQSYHSALNSYLTFCLLHGLPNDPSPETLSLYVAWQCSFISPASVDSYLSGICNELEAYYPQVRANRASKLVTQTLKGARRRYGRPTARKDPLTWTNLELVQVMLASSSDHDDYLFVAMLFTGFHALLRLGELTTHDKVTLRDPSKYTLRSSFHWIPDGFDFWLPRHKSDQRFEGNHIVTLRHHGKPDVHAVMRRYLTSRDSLFPLHPWLWLTKAGRMPTRLWFINRLRFFFPSTIAGHSMRAGGATALAEAGASLQIIKAAGCWSSDAFERYIRRNPIILHAIILLGGEAKRLSE